MVFDGAGGHTPAKKQRQAAVSLTQAVRRCSLLLCKLAQLLAAVLAPCADHLPIFVQMQQLAMFKEYCAGIFQWVSPYVGYDVEHDAYVKALIFFLAEPGQRDELYEAGGVLRASSEVLHKEWHKEVRSYVDAALIRSLTLSSWCERSCLLADTRAAADPGCKAVSPGSHIVPGALPPAGHQILLLLARSVNS